MTVWKMKTFTNIEDAFAYYTDCAIATLGYSGGLKSCSKTRRERYNNIARGMLSICRAYKVKDLERLENRYERLVKDGLAE